MCGICGYTKFNHSIEENINKMLDEIKQRGPDFFDKKIEESVSLAHSRLSIIDLSKNSNQPFVSEGGNYVIVYNGEMYNYKEIRTELEIKYKSKFRTLSDTEVVINGYAYLKENIFSKIEGMFSLAIWDRINKKLILARDVFGEKPLFYFRKNKDLFFASNIKSLSYAPMFDNTISNDSLKNYLYNNYVNSKKETIFKNVFKVEPGSYIEFDKKGFIEKKFHSFSKFQKNKNNKFEIEKTDDIIQKSVYSRMISDTEGGVFLSGGLDSSLIAYYASKIKSNLKCFTLGFEDKSYDESEKAKYVSKKLNVDHYIYRVNQKDLKNINKVILSLKEPLADSAIISNYFLSKFSRQYVKFCLSGDGADEIFSGYETYDATYLYKNIRKNSIYNPLVKIISNFSNYLPQSKSKINFLYKIKKFLQVYKTHPSNPHLFWRSVHNENEIKQVINKDYYEIFLSKKNINDQLTNDKSLELNYLNIIDIETFLAEDILVKTDRTSMDNGLEVRSPYLNLDLVKYIFNIKDDDRYKLFNKKIILKKLLIDKFGLKFANQNKRGFNAPISLWLKREIKDNFIETIQNEKTGIFNKKNILALHKKHQMKGFDYGNRLFNLLCLVLWINSNKVSYE